MSEVIYYYTALNRHLQIKVFDIPLIRELKKSILFDLKASYRIEKLHFKAAFFDPFQKDCAYVTDTNLIKIRTEALPYFSK